MFPQGVLYTKERILEMENKPSVEKISFYFSVFSRIWISLQLKSFKSFKQVCLTSPRGGYSMETNHLTENKNKNLHLLKDEVLRHPVLRPYGGQHLLFRLRSELHCGKPRLERRQVTAEWYLHLWYSECLAQHSLPHLIYMRCYNLHSLQSLRTNYRPRYELCAVCHQSLRSVVLNLPTDMQGPDLEAIKERIRHKCDHVCRHKQTKLISGTRR